MAAGTTRNKKKTAGKRLGVKKLGNVKVYPNDIVVRQRGYKWKPGLNTTFGRDHTILAKIEGVVKFTKQYYKDSRNVTKKITMVHILPSQHNNLTKDYFRPYVYHPEQFPELAEFNPKPFIYEEPVKFVPKKENPYKPLKASIPAKNLIIPETLQMRLKKDFDQQKEIESEDKFEIYEKQKSERIEKLNQYFQKIDNMDQLRKFDFIYTFNYLDNSNSQNLKNIFKCLKSSSYMYYKTSFLYTLIILTISLK